MSLILDALRKLDREKSSRRNRTSNIAAEVVKPDELRPPKKIWRPFAALSLTAVLAAVLTYAVVMKFDLLGKLSPSSPADSPASIQQVVPASPSAESVGEVRAGVKRMPPQIEDRPEREKPAPATQASSPAPAGAKPAGGQQVAPVPLPREPVREARGDVSQGPLETQPRAERGKTSSGPVPASPPVEAKPPGQQVAPAAGSGEPAPPSAPAGAKPAGGQQVAPVPLPREPVREARGDVSQGPPKIQDRSKSNIPATSPGESKAGRRVFPGKAEVTGGSRPRSAPAPRRGPAITPTALKISGIVWSEERSERRAVINGVFTTEGSVIEGVKVEEIYPTRVRFSHEGRFFEISVFE
jgi:hypothetical protein